MNKLAFICCLVVVAGCTHTTARYAPAAKNVSAIRASATEKAAVGSFLNQTDSELKSLACGAMQIAPPDGMSFPEYLREALISELRMADLYSPSAPLTLTGDLHRMEIDSSAFSLTSAWTIEMTVRSSNGKSLSVIKSHRFPSFHGDETSCEISARRLVDAVQDTLGEVVQAPEFRELMQAR